MTDERIYELLRLSLECYRSLRRKYSLRGHWTTEFQAWRKYFEDVSGEDLAAYDLEAIDRLFSIPRPPETP